MNEPILLNPIGRVENSFDTSAAPETIAETESRIILDPAFAEGLTGLESGDQLLVLFFFDRSEGYDLLQHPRGDRSRELLGVFSIRSPRRPNPIGATVVDVLQIDGNVLRVRGLDALNGTPILDLKRE
jgi:tRNA-Thr(GGU) m(6)t(6)A37 methyltransferase TsaA